METLTNTEVNSKGIYVIDLTMCLEEFGLRYFRFKNQWNTLGPDKWAILVEVWKTEVLRVI